MPLIWGGDFNCPLSLRDVDRENVKLKNKSISVINKIKDLFGLMDIWRVRNPESSQFTWRSLNPLIQRRLDYYLISSEIQPIISSVLIKPAVATDHSAIILQINSTPKSLHGPSHWRLNVSLLEDVEYVKVISDLINNIKHDTVNMDAKTAWEFIKYKVRQSSIAYSKNKAKQFREKMKNLENEVSLLEQNLFCNYDQYQLKKKQLEECYDKVTEGILIRSRVQCYEYGEKSTKYFLSQEQKNKRVIFVKFY